MVHCQQNPQYPHLLSDMNPFQLGSNWNQSSPMDMQSSQILAVIVWFWLLLLLNLEETYSLSLFPNNWFFLLPKQFHFLVIRPHQLLPLGYTSWLSLFLLLPLRVPLEIFSFIKDFLTTSLLPELQQNSSHHSWSFQWPHVWFIQSRWPPRTLFSSSTISHPLPSPNLSHILPWSSLDLAISWTLLITSPPPNLKCKHPILSSLPPIFLSLCLKAWLPL